MIETVFREDHDTVQFKVFNLQLPRTINNDWQTCQSPSMQATLKPNWPYGGAPI